MTRTSIKYYVKSFEFLSGRGHPDLQKYFLLFPILLYKKL